MDCYRSCNKDCDDLKKIYCLYRITKEQNDLLQKITSKSVCPECGEIRVGAKYKNRLIWLCTGCYNGLEEKYQRGKQVC